MARRGARTGRRRARALGLGLLLTSVAGGGTLAATVHLRGRGGGAHAPVARYVDALHGSDVNDGLSPGRAWRTLAPVSSAPLGPGDRVLLRRGSSWTAPLVISRSGTAGRPIVVEPYGAGPMPRISDASSCVEVRGDHVTVRGLRIDDCHWAGVEVYARGATVQGDLIMHCAAGVAVRSTATGTLVRANRLIENDRMSVLTRYPRNDDSGAFGVLVSGRGSRIVDNLITGSRAFSYDYGTDGAAVEIYGAVNTLVARNRSFGNDAFTELGKAGTADTVYLRNLVQSPYPNATFLNTHGTDHLGPVTGTVADHNTVRLTGPGSQGFVCGGTCSPALLSVRDDVIDVAGKVGYAEGSLDEGGNIYWGGIAQFDMRSTSRRERPPYIDLRAGDLRLAEGSPPVGAGEIARRGQPTR